GFKSHDLECAIGAALRPFAKRVDLKHAEFTLELEVRPEGAFFYSQRIAGPGGLPLGVEGRALCLISGGFDSSVAAWMLMKRGVALDFVFFNLAGQHYERSVLCVVRALCQQWAYGDKPVIHMIDFNPMQNLIRREVRGSFAQVVLK